MTSDAAPSRNTLSVAAAADYLGLGKSTLDKLRLRGGGPQFVKPPGCNRVLYRVSDLDAWMASSLRRSTSDVLEASAPARA
jgi:excisionase family DNA binding protein